MPALHINPGVPAVSTFSRIFRKKSKSWGLDEELKSEEDFAKVREGAKRKGKIKRIIDIDGSKSLKEVNFEA